MIVHTRVGPGPCVGIFTGTVANVCLAMCPCHALRVTKLRISALVSIEAHASFAILSAIARGSSICSETIIATIFVITIIPKPKIKIGFISRSLCMVLS